MRALLSFLLSFLWAIPVPFGSYFLAKGIMRRREHEKCALYFVLSSVMIALIFLFAYLRSALL